MNPYASFLADKEATEVLTGTPTRLEALANLLGPERINYSLAPGKWSAREIFCHLADCEVVFAFRLRQTLAEDHHVIQPFDQDAWSRRYNGYDAHAALAVFSAVRNWNLQLIQQASQAELAKKNTHPERGEGSFGEIVETMAGHDLNHVKQIEAITKKVAA
jgi:DinB superfamily